ncbi:hypothetical protein [Rossellomorea vietnamensis]|uniref:hypothetical protein n=1 Tax=Rossellomorea vietnamensis TaxID=218284 RepID=UPI0016537F09|nr:hypothetical protein [Rossellomorea vietnamensis]
MNKRLSLRDGPCGKAFLLMSLKTFLYACGSKAKKTALQDRITRLIDEEKKLIHN